MKVCIQQFLGQNHSWSICGQNIARSLKNKGHTVHLSSTNGYEHFPADLLECVHPKLDKEYEVQLSYTAMKNFPLYLSHGNQNRFGIWNYETTVLPSGFAKYYTFTDRFLPSSNFSKQIFMDNGIPESHMTVVPHGIDLDAFLNKNKFPLKTKKKFKILANIAQPHIRKNIPGLLEAFGKAFTNKDDVCLVAKINIKKTLESQFEVDVNYLIERFKSKYRNHAEIEIITKFIPNIVELYNSCDAVFSMTHCECFWLPGVEAFAAGKLTIAPNYGGQLDFMNESNSLLIEGQKIPAPKSMQYWTGSPFAAMFQPNVEDAIAKLQLAYREYDQLMNRFAPVMKEQAKIYTWDNAVEKIIGLCE